MNINHHGWLDQNNVIVEEGKKTENLDQIHVQTHGNLVQN